MSYIKADDSTCPDAFCLLLLAHCMIPLVDDTLPLLIIVISRDSELDIFLWRKPGNLERWRLSVCGLIKPPDSKDPYRRSRTVAGGTQTGTGESCDILNRTRTPSVVCVTGRDGVQRN
jgi:hypothetical protein